MKVLLLCLKAFHKKTSELIQLFHKQNKPIATVCVAALALAKSGILFGKRATTYHLLNGLRQKELAEYEGITVVNEPVVIDESIITSYCPETAVRVAFSLLELLTSKQIRREIEELMGY